MTVVKRQSRFSGEFLRRAHQEAGLGTSQTVAAAGTGQARLADHGQQDIWFFEQVNPDALVHQVALRIRMDGPLDVPALYRAIQAVVDRHDAFRACFPVVDGTPRLTVPDTAKADIETHDVADDEQWRALVDRAVHRPFDLVAGPLVRFVLGRFAAGRHELLVTIHHIVSDGHTLALLHKDIPAAYAGGRLDPAGDLAGYVAERRAAADRPWLAERLERSVTNLADLPAPAARWPSFGRTPPGESDPFAADIVPIPPAADLRAIAEAEKASPVMVWLTALAVLVNRMSNVDDVVTGTVLDGRHGARSDQLAGYLANVVALRFRLPPNPTWREVLHLVRDTALDAFDDADLPFRRIVERASPQRRSDVHPIFQIMLTTQQPLEPVTRDGVTFTSAEHLSRRALYELEFHVPNSTNGSTGHLRYQTRALDRDAAQAVAQQFARLVRDLVENPDKPIWSLDLSAKTETQAPAQLRSHTINGLFEHFANTTPNAHAIGSTSYRGLNESANQLAHHLCALGVQPQDRVGIMLPAAEKWATAALAVVKAGGCYVALDPRWPDEFLAAVLADAQVNVVVSDRQVPGVRVAHPDADAIAEQPTRCPDLHTNPGHLAYLAYTVGSSGHPVAVAVEHRNIACPDAFPSGTVLAQTSDLATDGASLELWSALLTGRRLVPVSGEELTNPDRLAERLRASGVDTLVLTTALAHRIAREAPDVVSHLQQLIVTGDRPDPNAMARLRATGLPKLRSAYGTTETAMTVGLADDTASLGRPLLPSRWHVLDRYMRPVPPGARGELYVGGAGVARGYHSSPALTASRFVPDPYGPPGSRLFRTGDLVLRRGDGELEFLGRADRRVKLDGRRVDLDVVEACLRDCAKVSDVSVHIRHDRLVGYIVAASDTETVRQHLLRLLPPWFVPELVVVPTIPADPSTLPDPDVPTKPARQAPATETEERVLRAWREVLEMPNIGTDDNFFTLGGHSLNAVRVAARLSTDFGRTINARVLFDHPTVATTAAVLDQPTAPDAVPIRAVRRRANSLTDLLARAEGANHD